MIYSGISHDSNGDRTRHILPGEKGERQEVKTDRATGKPLGNRGKMNTLFDYLTHVKGIEYILALLFLAGYILFAELLKPTPFKTIRETTKENVEFVGKTGYKSILKTVSRTVAAPFIGLAYVAALPFVFMFAIGTAALHGIVGMAHRSISFGWRPMEAYLSGRKKRKGEKRKEEGQ